MGTCAGQEDAALAYTLFDQASGGGAVLLRCMAFELLGSPSAGLGLRRQSAAGGGRRCCVLETCCLAVGL
jgi:hypothetical protein